MKKEWIEKGESFELETINLLLFNLTFSLSFLSFFFLFFYFFDTFVLLIWLPIIVDWTNILMMTMNEIYEYMYEWKQFWCWDDNEVMNVVVATHINITHYYHTSLLLSLLFFSLLLLLLFFHFYLGGSWYTSSTRLFGWNFL